jgi:hypothetical protein
MKINREGERSSGCSDERNEEGKQENENNKDKKN